MATNSFGWLRHILALKPLTLIAATGLSLAGSLGQFFAIDSWDDYVNAKASELRAIEKSVATLRESQNQYFSNYIQANLLFALNPTDTARDRGVTGLMYKVALLDKAVPFRAILTELLAEGATDIGDIHKKYMALAEAAQKDLSYENYSALNNFERDVLDRAFKTQRTLEDRYLDAQEEKSEAEVARDNRRYWLTILMAIGTLLLLGANLIASRSSAPAGAEAPGPHGA